MPGRVRHHTDDKGLKGIRRDMAIQAARGWGPLECGVHVELEPFGPVRPGLAGPKAELDCCGEGAFVEFDAPENLLEYSFSSRKSGVIPLGAGEVLSLEGRHPRFVWVRRLWWEFWRTAE